MKKKKEKFNLLIIPDDGRKVKNISFSLKRVIIIFFLLWLSLSIILFFIIGFRIKSLQEKEYKEQVITNLVLNKQIEDLNPSSIDFTNFLIYLENKKQKLKETEQKIEKLKLEQEKLEPIISANKEIVDTILRSYLNYQSEEFKKNNFKSLLISLLISFFSSFIAGLITYKYFALKAKKQLMIKT